VSFASAKKKAVADKLTETAAPYVKKTKQVYEKRVVPPAEKTKALYNAHVRPQVKRAAETAQPLFKTYVAPYAKKTRTGILRARATTRKKAKLALTELTSHYKAACPSAMSTLKSYSAPPSVIKSVQKSCQNAEESVAAVLKAIALVLVILLRWPIWRLLLWTIRLLLGVAWYFSPIRILFFRRKKKAAVKKSNGYSKKNGLSPSSAKPRSHQSSGK
jgi:hypothetical protein